MNILSTILLIINILCIVLFVMLLPLVLYDYFGGRERLDAMLEKLNVRFRWKTVDNIAVILLFIAFVSYIVRDILN